MKTSNGTYTSDTDMCKDCSVSFSREFPLLRYDKQLHGYYNQ